MPITTEPALPTAAGDRELKYSLQAGRVGMVRRMLASSCRPDPEHPAACVWTIYYDTPQLTSLGEKINSDYLKVKVRVRWYSDVEHRSTGPVFIEVKRRVGACRDKVRVQAPFAAEDLAQWDLRDERLRSLPLLLRARGIDLPELRHPVVLIRYRRDRFVDPVSRARVNLDSEIAAVAVHPSFASSWDPRSLEVGILEIKGQLEDLPIALRPAVRLGARKESFSKFVAIHRHVTRAIY
jgi:hypothetical protein